jgi:polyhydroxyalkanoate synthase
MPAPDLVSSDVVERSVGGAEVSVPLDRLQLVQALSQVLSRVDNVSREAFGLVAEAVKVLGGASAVTPEPRDWRFADPAWKDHPVYRRWAQAYLAWSRAMDRLVDEAELDWRTTERARFAMSLLTSAAAPTNFLAGNPAAIKRGFDTAGWSLLRGVRNLLRDAVHNGGMPSQVDTRPFVVGQTVAVTPGAVVHRDEVCEVIQYAPSTADVSAYPVLVVPPQINKYYFLDLAPGRSFVEYAASRGLQVFMMSWRNPTVEQRDWDLDTYVDATLRAFDVACDVGGSGAAHIAGFCAGGITASVAESVLAARRDERLRTVSFAVTLLDWHVPSTVGLLGTPAIVHAGVARSAKAGVLDGRALGHLFSWLRPNDLVWNYWVNNNLMGQDPPAFDVLAWNADSTDMPAALHADFLDLFLHNSLTAPGAIKALGTPVDLESITCDAYVVGGQTDHLTPWRGCYATTQLLGGRSRFVLTSSGHIQSQVTPPGSPKMRLFTGPDPGPDPDEWLAASSDHLGTWWEDWADWIIPRSGPARPAPDRLGTDAHPEFEPAPGRYVRKH